MCGDAVAVNAKHDDWSQGYDMDALAAKALESHFGNVDDPSMGVDESGVDVKAVLQALFTANTEFDVRDNRSAVAAEVRYRPLLACVDHMRLRATDVRLLRAKVNFGTSLRIQGRHEAAVDIFITALEPYALNAGQGATSSGSSAEPEPMPPTSAEIRSTDFINPEEARVVCELRMNLAICVAEQRKQQSEQQSSQQSQGRSAIHEEKYFSEAAEDLDKLVDVWSLTLQNPVVLSFRQAFAAHLLRKGNLQGEEIWREALQASASVFGADDVHTLACKQGLAVHLAGFRLTSDCGEKQPSSSDKQQSRSQSSGDKQTSKKQSAGGSDIVAQKAGERGVALLREILEVHERTQLPGEWQKVELTKLKLAEMLIEKVWPPQLQEGEELLHDVLQMRARRLHEDDRSLWDLRWALGACLWQQGKREDAAELFHACWMARQRLLGPDHPDTQAASRYYKRAAESSRTPCMAVCVLQ